MNIETERIIIRSIRRGDEKAYAKMAEDGSLAEIGFDENFSDWAEDWINEAVALTEKDDPRADYIPCTIVLKTTGEVIGNVGCTYYEDTDRIGICYFAGTAYRRHGYVSEAVQAYISYFFDHYNEKEIIATIKDNNIPSWKTAEKCGFELMETKMYKDIDDEKEDHYRNIKINGGSQVLSMNSINDTKTVKKQYAATENLSTRISIHDKYSTNKMGFGNWIFSNYDIRDGMKVLELGCGTGSMWMGHEDVIRLCRELVISDYSEAMISKARENIGDHPNITYKQIDIMDIPFEDDTFDAVIANMMLYHVPDINRGLNEVRRVLKSSGSFYCATFGIHGIMEYLSGLLSEYGVEDKTDKSFTLQNGASILDAVFTCVRREDYKDSLAVTDVNDLVNYIYSLQCMTSLSVLSRDAIRECLSLHMKDGILTVPKEYGMFIAKNQWNTAYQNAERYMMQQRRGQQDTQESGNKT